MRYRFGWLACGLLLLAAAMVAAQTAAARREAVAGLPRKILGHLGRDAAASLLALSAGKGVHSGLKNPAEASEEVFPVSGTLLIQGVPPAQAVAAFVAPHTFTRAHPEHYTHSTLPSASPTLSSHESLWPVVRRIAS